ncbi:MAG: RDD family protein [Bdellovibrionales bacterium]
MVIDDWLRRSEARTAKSGDPSLLVEETPLALARPLDRLAAAIIDVFVLLVPIYILISAPLKRWLMASFILGAEPEFLATILAMTLVAVLLLIGYQTVSHYYYGATLGKRIYDLRVVSMFSGEKLGFWDQILRSTVWVAEIFLLGLPWLSIFSNPKRRPLHDRVADTVVVTRSPTGVRAPMQWERGLVRGIFVGLFAIASLSTSVFLRGLFDKLRMEKALSMIDLQGTGECEVVANALDDSSMDPHHRLKTAMTLYAAGLADRACLEVEVEAETGRQIPIGPITYLAQAFIYADDAEISNSYLDEVCETAPGSVECSMSQLVTSWSDEDWKAVEEILKSAPRGSGYMEVWGVRHFMKQAAYGQALTLLDDLAPHKELAEFSMVQRVRALFNSFRESEAVAAYQQAALALPVVPSEDLSSWLCHQQLQNGCDAVKGPACAASLKEDNLADIDTERPSQALSQVLALECKGGGQVDYLNLTELVRDRDWQTFFRANHKRQKQDRSASGELFSELLRSNSAPEPLRIEAARRWVQFATPKQMARIVKEWDEFQSREGWVKIGNILFSRLAEQNNSKLALSVAKRLAQDESLSPIAMRILSGLGNGTQEMERRPAREEGDEE